MDSQTTQKALKLMEITDWKLCSHCLGRKFSKTVEGEDNKFRGEYIKKILSDRNYRALYKDSCYICGNIFDDVENGTIEKIVNKLEDEKIEFETFLVGSRLIPEILVKEEEIHKFMELDVENIKKEINREIGKKLATEIQKEVDFQYPDVVITVDFIKDEIELQINPLFIEGRYRKLIRGIPQTKWPCRKCKGNGCPNCNYTGQMYLESIEELISAVPLHLFKGSDSKFHGAGREDIDVKMLGNGRPFVLEIKEPKFRKINLESLKEKINEHAHGKVEVLNLKFTERKKKSIIKNSSKDTYKVYRAIVETEDEINEEKLDQLNLLDVINQRTPLRVSHRRADKIRTRKIRSISTKIVDPTIFEMIIECEGGLYIKELISGDECRTSPSVSEILGKKALCIKLDVLEVHI